MDCPPVGARIFGRFKVQPDITVAHQLVHFPHSVEIGMRLVAGAERCRMLFGLY